MSSALTFSHPYQGLFADKYERNNKKGGVKAMKCFPTCTLINREHGRGTLCIDSVIASVDTAKVSSYFNYQPVDVIGVGRFVTDIDIMMNDKYFGDFIVYKEGEKYDQVTVTKLLRSKQFPFNPEIYAELDNQNNLTFSSRGWHYGWSGGRYKVHQPHRFEVIAFARPRSSPNSPYTCIGAIQGSNFGLFSSRRADPNDKLKRRVSRGLMALNAAERFASQKEEEILRKLETSSSTTPRNDSENDGDVDDALSFNQSPDFNSGNKSDDDDYDPFLKAGKRAAIQQYTKTVGNKAKKNKISGNNIPSYMQQRPDATFVPNVQYKAILPIASHGFGDRKVVKTEHHNPINYSFPSPMINPPSGDPATLAAMMVLQQNNNGAQNKAQDSFLGDIIMNPILSPQNPRTANNNNRMPNGNAQYLASPGFNFGMHASPSSINANMHNQAITFANDDMDQVDSLLNDLVSFEQAMGVEIESETPSETELNQPIAIPIIDAKREVNYSNKTVCKDEFCPSMQPPGMENHSSPGAYSSDEFVSAESDEELFKDIDILQVLGSISSKLKISTEESVKPAIKDVTQAVDITSTSEKANAAELPAKKVTINENANIIIENNLSVSENLKKNEARLEKLQSLINDYAAWNFVKKRFAQMKINKVKIVKRKQVYFFPVPVTII